MEILYPMVISAVAVLATLIYASYLDIRDRRVPFIHWLPMLVMGVICTGYLLWQTTANLSLIFGYLSLVASFLYADYLDNRGRTDSLGLTFYYRKTSIFLLSCPCPDPPDSVMVCLYTHLLISSWFPGMRCLRVSFPIFHIRNTRACLMKIPGKKTGKRIRISLSLSTAGILY